MANDFTELWTDNFKQATQISFFVIPVQLVTPPYTFALNVGAKITTDSWW